jgi:hypothetical protein
MFAPSPLEQQLATTWQAARTDGLRAPRTTRRRRLFRLVRAPR